MIPTTTPVASDDSHLRPIYGQDEIDLRQLAKALWRYRRWVFLLGFVGALVGLGVSLMSTAYVSQGLFLTPGVKVSEYKPYEAALNNGPRLEEFLRLAKFEDAETKKLLSLLVERPGSMSNAARPVFAMTGRDAKSYDIQAPAQGAGKLVGIQLSMERNRVSGTAPVLALAEYLRSTMIKVDLKDVLLNECLTYQARDQELRNEQIQSNFSIAQLETRVATLRRLIAENPSAASIEGRQVVSLENGAERFLSPAAQLVAAEVGILDLKLADEQRGRARVAAGLKKDYYCRGRAAQETPITGQALLVRLKDVRDEVFESQDHATEIVEQTANEIDLQRQKWSDRYLERMRFVVSPDGAERKIRKPSMSIGLIFGAFAGVLLGALLALALAWWHDNSREITRGDDV